jgi:hypothetical protein
MILAALSRSTFRSARLEAAEGGPDALQLVLHDNQISQQQREWLERPEN